MPAAMQTGASIALGRGGNPVRVIDAFVDKRDLNKLGFETVEALDLGRPGYHPSVHLKLYIYGYLNRVQSSRAASSASASVISK
jgi:transposase